MVYTSDTQRKSFLYENVDLCHLILIGFKNIIIKGLKPLKCNLWYKF